MSRQKTLWAYFDGEKMVDVAQATRDHNITVEEMRWKLILENHAYDVSFRME